MKHWKVEGCDAKDSTLCLDRLHSRMFIRLSLEKGEANRATPLQSMVSPDLVRWQNSWPHSENRI